MTNENSTLLDTNLNAEEARAGAKACIGALFAIERIASDKSDLWDKHWQIQDAAVATILHAAGKQDFFMTGFLAVLAEYSMISIESELLNLQKWKPEAAMSAEEKKIFRKNFEMEAEGISA